jgi:hypothetical protein
MKNLTTRELYFATLLVQAGNITITEVADLFKVDESIVTSFQNFTLSNFKQQIDHEGVTIFAFTIKRMVDGKNKVVATYEDDYMNGPIRFDVKCQESVDELVRIGLGEDAEFIASEMGSSYSLLKKVYQPRANKSFITVDLLGDLNAYFEQGFKNKPAFSKVAATEKGREALSNFYTKVKARAASERGANSYEVVVNNPQSLAKLGAA